MFLDEALVEPVGLKVTCFGTNIVKGGGKAEDSLRIVGQERQSLAQVHQCFWKPFEGNQDSPQIAACVAVIWIECNGFLEGIERQFGLAHTKVGAADADPGMRMGRVQLNGAFEPDHGLVELSHRIAAWEAQNPAQSPPPEKT